MSDVDVIKKLKEVFFILYDYFSSPGKRTYVVYLITSLIMAFFIYNKSSAKRSFFNYIFNKKVWFSSSSFTDYLITIFNSFVKVFLIAPFIILGVYLQNQINMLLIENFGEFQFAVSTSIIVVLYTFTIWIIGDFASFFLHFLMHKIPFFWEFHKTHHSATVLNPFTQYRIHPVELFLVNIKGFLVYGLVTGVFFYIAQGQVGTITFIGINIFKFFFLAIGANLRHSHVRFKFPNWIEYLFISPFQHQVHHSDAEKHFNKNLGSQLAIWDWLFGTLIRSKQINNKVNFGLGKKENKDFNSFWKSILTPFRKAFRI